MFRSWLPRRPALTNRHCGHTGPIRANRNRRPRRVLTWRQSKVTIDAVGIRLGRATSPIVSIGPLPRIARSTYTIVPSHLCERTRGKPAANLSRAPNFGASFEPHTPDDLATTLMLFQRWRPTARQSILALQHCRARRGSVEARAVANCQTTTGAIRDTSISTSALRSFPSSPSNGRLPCPSDLFATSSQAPPTDSKRLRHNQ